MFYRFFYVGLRKIYIHYQVKLTNKIFVNFDNFLFINPVEKCPSFLKKYRVLLFDLHVNPTKKILALQNHKLAYKIK